MKKSFYDRMADTILKNRNIALTEEISNQIADDIIGKLIYLDSLSKDPIKLIVNSPGGCVNSGLAIIDIIKSIKAPVYSYSLGLVASMAVPIICSTAKSVSYKNTYYMMHQVSMFHFGADDSDTIQTNAKYCKQLEKVTNGIIANKTKKTIKEIERKTVKELYLNAEEALNWGLVDEII